MGDADDLTREETITRIREIARGEVALLSTTSRPSPRTRPMTTAGIDDDGTMWFLSARDTPLNDDLERDPSTQLTYSTSARSHYLMLTGTARVVVDRGKVDELWSPSARSWFAGGKDDPSLTLIRFIPHGGHYWDTRQGRMVALASVTGDEPDRARV